MWLIVQVEFHGQALTIIASSRDPLAPCYVRAVLSAHDSLLTCTPLITELRTMCQAITGGAISVSPRPRLYMPWRLDNQTPIDSHNLPRLDCHPCLPTDNNAPCMPRYLRQVCTSITDSRVLSMQGTSQPLQPPTPRYNP